MSALSLKEACDGHQPVHSKGQEAISSAQTKAVRYGHQQVDVEHLLASLLEQEGGLATSILNKAEINTDSFKRRVEQELDRMPKVSAPCRRARPDLCDGSSQSTPDAGRRRSQEAQG